MNHLDTFRQYSQFCAAQHELEYILSKNGLALLISLSKTLFVLVNVTNRQKMEEFLEVRNPKQSPSLKLTALLTKPVLVSIGPLLLCTIHKVSMNKNTAILLLIQRLLRYPLFLQALKDMSDKDSEEHQTLKGFAINQRIEFTTDEYYYIDTLTSVSMVTEYINEVKRVTESYANVFDTILEVSGLVEVS